jgi:two-component system, OmpR family, sensor histidine kinase VicK
MVSESEYLAPIVLFEKGKVASQIIYSNVKEIVEHQQYTFDSFWSKATPAQEQIREIEEGAVPIRTILLEDQDEVIKEIRRLNNSANNLLFGVLTQIPKLVDPFFQGRSFVLGDNLRQ